MRRNLVWSLREGKGRDVAEKWKGSDFDCLAMLRTTSLLQPSIP